MIAICLSVPILPSPLLYSFVRHPFINGECWVVFCLPQWRIEHNTRGSIGHPPLTSPCGSLFVLPLVTTRAQSRHPRWESALTGRGLSVSDVSASARSADWSLQSGSLSARSDPSSAGGPPRSPDARRAQGLLREGLRVDELGQALWKADFCQEFPSCPASPCRDWPASSEESRSVGTQTALLEAPAADGGTYRCETVRRRVRRRHGTTWGGGGGGRQRYRAAEITEMFTNAGLGEFDSTRVSSCRLNLNSDRI